MPTKREYLVNLGLAKPGRGRFSVDGKAALAKAEADGVVFTDGKESPESPDSEHSAPRSSGAGGRPSVSPVTPVSPPWGSKYNIRPKVRNVKQVTGQDSDGNVIGFSECARCFSHVNYCRCPKGIKPPKIVTMFVDDSPRLG